MRRVALAAVGLALLGTGVGLRGHDVPARAALSSSLPSVSSGARPGPDILYAPPPAVVPQLENRNPRFEAAFVPVSGTEVYTGGEYIYTDHLYDDFGSDTQGTGGQPLSPNTGDLTYPPDTARFGNNAADLFELRIAPTPEDVAYRISLNTLLAPDSTLVALVFDRDGDIATGAPVLARDPGAPFPGTDEVLYIWGTGAEWSHWDGSAWTATPLTGVIADLEANQLTVVVPRTVADPTGAWKATLATGLYDPGSGGWLAPEGSSPTDPDPVDILNLGFRFDEPVTAEDVPPDTAQAAALRAKTPTAFQRDIDFAALTTGEARSTVPATGTMVRWFPSRLDLGEGKDFDSFPGYKGKLQPYSLYVPSTYSPATPAGLTLNLHSLSELHWQYNGSTGIQQLGEGRGNLVATALARGDDGWYQHEAEYDVFEMWNDVVSRYSLDPDRTALTGYSMGGYATYRLGTLYPDLFGKAMTIVGPPGDGIWVPPAPPTGGIETLSNLWLENARNLPYLNIVSTEDELVPIAGTTQQSIGPAANGLTSFDALGYRFRFQNFNPGDHLHLALLSYDLPQGAEFMGDGAVDRNPYHVTFSYSPAADDPELGLVHDHAYWVSAIVLADPAVGDPIPEATVDARSHTSGVGDPESTSGVDAGNSPTPYTEVNRSWATPPPIPRENKLTIAMTNVGSVTLDARRAGLDLDAEITLDVDATSAGTLRLLGERAVDIAVSEGPHTYVLAARALRQGAVAAPVATPAPPPVSGASLPGTGALPTPVVAGLAVAVVGLTIRRGVDTLTAH
jgi:poly(3-hydroxybutyrate) depolymerase